MSVVAWIVYLLVTLCLVAFLTDAKLERGRGGRS
jgi:hypothetical protein